MVRIWIEIAANIVPRLEGVLLRSSSVRNEKKAEEKKGKKSSVTNQHYE